MHALLPYLMLYKRHKWMLLLGGVLAVVTLLANIGLLTLSSWFLSTSAVVGVSGIYSFNYMLPAAGVRVAAIIRTVGRYFERLVSHDATFRVLQHLRVDTFSKLLPLSPTGLMRFRQGELLNRVVADVDTLDHLYLRVLSPIVVAFVVIWVVMLGLSVIDLTLALILGCIMLLALFILPPLFYLIGKSTGEKLTYLRGEYRQQLIAWLQGQAELTIFCASGRYRAQMENTELNWHKAQRRQADITAFSKAMLMIISGMTVITMLWIAAGSSVVGDSQQQLGGTLSALFAFCALATFEALSPVIGAFQDIGQVIASARRITQVIEQEPEVRFIGKSSEKPLQIALRLERVSFSYVGQPQSTLKEVTLFVAAGTHVAVLGRTGCGKSTLLQLLTRAWDPQQGTITLNDIPLSQFSERALRAAISMVPQRVHIFSATLRDNLLLALPDASDEKLCSVLKQVGLHKLLEDDGGLNGWLGEGGRQLSGGEIRRLAIARVLLHDAPLILMDEPTEGLDDAAETQVFELLAEAMHGKTLIIVTHRLHRLANYFASIIVMENGQIIEKGNHAELMDKRGRYYQFNQRIF